MPTSHYRAGGIQNFLAQESHSENFARQRRHLANDIKAIGKTRVVFTKMWGDYRSFIGADSTGATGNFAPVLTQEPGQTLRFAPVPFTADFLSERCSSTC